MTVAPTGAAAATSQLPAGATKTSADRFSEDMDQFLKIFITQLNHQDPLEPTDTSDFVNQMANMSGVEQAVNTNKKLDTLIGQNTQRDNSTLISFIGKDVQVDSQAVMLEEGKNVRFSYSIDADNVPKGTYVTVKDAKGNVVFNGEGTENVGVNPVAWDGTNNKGEKLAPGIYQVFVTGDYGDNKLSALTTTVTGKVMGANLSAATPTIVVNGAEIPLDEVKFIGDLS